MVCCILTDRLGDLRELPDPNVDPAWWSIRPVGADPMAVMRDIPEPGKEAEEGGDVVSSGEFRRLRRREPRRGL